MHFFDTHCHLDVAAFDADRMDVLQAARSAQVQHLLVPAIQRKGWEKLLTFCAKDNQLYPALGLHPVMLDQHSEDDVQVLATKLAQYRPIAIGEIGLDYAIKSLDKAKQQALFEAQLALAAQHQLPVILHVRKAHDVVLNTLKRYPLSGGICHAFNGSLQQAARYIDLGFKLGFGGMLTYPSANRLHKLARELPLEAMVLETDAPDMTGIAHRYQRNSPAYLPEAAEKLARLRDMSLEEIAQATTQNARGLLLG